MSDKIDREALYRFGKEVPEAYKRVVNLASSMFGFERRWVVPLESAEEPSNYCMFEVLCTQYQVRDGDISVYRQSE